jgi:two-component system, response regulator, stage 0 sporulation protein F
MHFADSADEALKRLRAGIVPPLIVILADINMPGMDGFDLLSEIKRQWPELPVIMVTAYGDEERRLRAREFGALDFLTKPVDFHHLKTQLQELTTLAVDRPSSYASAPRCLTQANGGAAKYSTGDD